MVWIFISRTRCSQGHPLAEACAHLQLASLTSVFTGHTMPSSASLPLPTVLVAGTPHPFYRGASRSQRPRGLLIPSHSLGLVGTVGTANHSEAPGGTQVECTRLRPLPTEPNGRRKWQAGIRLRVWPHAGHLRRLASPV